MVVDHPNRDQPSSLRDLTTKLAEGNDDAWRQFHRDFGPGIFRQLLAATCGNYDLASEALQQTYLRAAKNVRACDSEPMFRAWLRLVSRSALSDCRRRSRSFWSLLERRSAESNEAGAEAADEESLFAALDLSLSKLDPGDRALLEAKYFSGSDVRTIAAHLDISPKAAESRLTRARTELRRLLEAAPKTHE